MADLQHAEHIIRNTWTAGFAIGLILGVPLIAREVDHGTAQLAWTIGRSRVRWLIGRVAFAALVAVVLTGLLAVTTELLVTAMLPDHPGCALQRDRGARDSGVRRRRLDPGRGRGGVRAAR